MNDVDVEMGDVRHVRIHHSRVLRFVGRELPRREMEGESYWGASELEHIWDELQKRSPLWFRTPGKQSGGLFSARNGRQP